MTCENRFGAESFVVPLSVCLVRCGPLFGVPWSLMVSALAWILLRTVSFLGFVKFGLLFRLWTCPLPLPLSSFNLVMLYACVVWSPLCVRSWICFPFCLASNAVCTSKLVSEWIALASVPSGLPLASASATWLAITGGLDWRLLFQVRVPGHSLSASASVRPCPAWSSQTLAT